MTRFSNWAGPKPGEGAGGDSNGRPKVESFVVVNSILQSTGRGVKYRRSANLEDKFANKLATFGTVVRGVLFGTDWLKLGSRLFLPVKIDGLYVLVKPDGGGLSIVKREVSLATVHFRLEVSGCRHLGLGNKIRGSFARVDDHHGKAAYRRVDHGGNEDLEAACYFWDKRDGARFSGWWFGPSVGSDQGWAQNPKPDPAPPRYGWQVPWGEQVDERLSAKLVETRAIEVSGHSNSSYDGIYELQMQAVNGHPMFKKSDPYRVLYCFFNGSMDEIRWNLDSREQPGNFDWADGGTCLTGHLPLGELKWHQPINRLTLTCADKVEDSNSDKEAPARDEESREPDPWSLIEPWEAWYSEKLKCPVFYNSLTGERVFRLEDTTVSPGVIRALRRVKPRYAGTVDRIADPAPKGPSERKGVPAPVPVEAPSEPGVLYVVAQLSRTERHVAKIHKSPDHNSREFTFIEEGGMVELYDWDSDHKWRRYWYAFGLDQSVGCWAWVSFFDESGRAQFKPKDWVAPGPLPFGILGVAIHEDDKLLLRSLILERCDLEEKEHNLTPLLLAEMQGRPDICVRLLDAGASLPSDGHRPFRKTPTGALLSALAGKEDFEVRAMDLAMDDLTPDMREVAESMLERIAEEQRLRRQLDGEKFERERGMASDERSIREAREAKSRESREREREEIEAERWAKEKAEKRRIAQDIAASNEERLRRMEQERAAQAQERRAEPERDRPARPKGEPSMPPIEEEEPRPAPSLSRSAEAELEIVRQRRAAMMEKRSRRVAEVHQSQPVHKGEDGVGASSSAGSAAAAAAAPPPPQPPAESSARAAAPPPAAPAATGVDPEQAAKDAIEQRRERSRKLKEERQRKAREEYKLQQHEERLAKLEAEGDFNKIERERRTFELQMQEEAAEKQKRAEEERRRQQEEREREAEEERQRASVDEQLKAAQDKWTCGECNFDNPQSSNICLFCDTERGARPISYGAM